MDAADIIIFGTPNYWYGPSAKTKLLFDRLRPYTSNNKLKGKKAILVVPAADGPEVSSLIVDMFQLSLAYLEMYLTGHVLGTAYEKGEILKDKKTLSQAFELGVSI